jgi:transcriptional regulator with PAS, ATPase and Fis domain
MDLQSIKQRFGIVGNSPLLNRAIDIATQVAHTDLSVLVTGESGVGKEFFPKIIHHISPRKHGAYIAVNCGAIPEGTIDSELFGHEKGSFTGATDSRKGYFEVADGGTLFLDEVAELPLSTQVRLLRVLETGEFIRVGSSKVIKTNVRVVAATNINLGKAIEEGKFRQDLFYRLSSVPIFIPPLRDRKDDILLLFRKFAADFAEKYRMPTIRLSEDAQQAIMNYPWYGNIRQLKNVTEQLSIIEQERMVNKQILSKYLTDNFTQNLPVPYSDAATNKELSEREILYTVMFELKRELMNLKKVVSSLTRDRKDFQSLRDDFQNFESKFDKTPQVENSGNSPQEFEREINTNIGQDFEYKVLDEIEESLSLQEKEKEMIQKALDKFGGKRKYAAKELGISERTLYRKINEYELK